MVDLSTFGIHATPPHGESLTQPEHRDECDMNVVFRRLRTQGIAPLKREVKYGSEDMNLDRLTHEINKASAIENLKLTFSQLKEELKLPDLTYEAFIKNPSKYLKKLEQPPKVAEQPPAGPPEAPKASPVPSN